MKRLLLKLNRHGTVVVGWVLGVEFLATFTVQRNSASVGTLYPRRQEGCDLQNMMHLASHTPGNKESRANVFCRPLWTNLFTKIPFGIFFTSNLPSTNRRKEHTDDYQEDEESHRINYVHQATSCVSVSVSVSVTSNRL